MTKGCLSVIGKISIGSIEMPFLVSVFSSVLNDSREGTYRNNFDFDEPTRQFQATNNNEKKIIFFYLNFH
jgi:hypothetical protein